MMDETQAITADGVPFQEGMTLWQCKWRKVDGDPEQFQREVEIAANSYGQVVPYRIDQLYSTELAAVRSMIRSIDDDINDLQEVREAWAEWQRELEN